MLKEGRAKAVRFTTLAALCEVLECRPGDLLRWEAEDGADAMGAVGGGTQGRRGSASGCGGWPTWSRAESRRPLSQP